MRRAISSAGVMFVLGTPTPAAAAQPGVFFDDPDSPASKEYALPLDLARREAADDSKPTRATPEPFGAGVEPRGSVDRASADSRGSDTPSGAVGASGDDGGGGADGGGGSGGERSSRIGDAARLGETSSPGISPQVESAAAAGAVLLAGAALGLALRLRRRGRQS